MFCGMKLLKHYLINHIKVYVFIGKNETSLNRINSDELMAVELCANAT